MLLCFAVCSCWGHARTGYSQEYDGNRILLTTIQPPDRSATNAARFGLTRNDFAALTQQLTAVRYVVPVREVQRDARVSNRVRTIQLLGTHPEYASVHRLKTIRGRFLNAADVKRARNVVVLGSRLAARLFPGEDPIGRNVRVDRNYYLVLGIVDTSEPLAYIPLTTMKGRMGDRDITRSVGQFEIRHFELSRIEIIPQDAADTPQLTEIATQILQALHEDDGSFRLSVSQHE
ncbi:ABC transporter permease [Roseimaritima ulvae]|uniref:MacB-like periplasmic core domain protein n=1 Tax=Roseimaritima ulvae TaxID=980254 RepID=A0A5B9QR16_9BACT|nr:ABC transporter permease [Roseimaritima ulvae]QEG39865.1 MacB-like periplasmic core domain protein [Roseimaritima ulvae]